jgi:hypothetical protein
MPYPALAILARKNDSRTLTTAYAQDVWNLPLISKSCGHGMKTMNPQIWLSGFLEGFAGA